MSAYFLTLKLNHAERTIIMDKTFAKFAANTMSAEYSAAPFSYDQQIGWSKIFQVQW